MTDRGRSESGAAGGRIILSAGEVLDGYRALGAVYPFVPSLLLWRAWEHAAYRRFSLEEPVLDVGCGDGQFFRLLWPGISDVTGIDLDPAVAEGARSSGVYREVVATPANRLPFGDGRFAMAFANCSLEHMDDLDGTLREVARCVRPGGRLICSVVTDKFIAWAPLPELLRLHGAETLARESADAYARYHHLCSAFTEKGWTAHMEKAGFTVDAVIPILPELTGRLFLFLDQLWHLRRGGRALGDELGRAFSAMPEFGAGLFDVLSGLLRMERDFAEGCGIVFCARKVR